MTTDKAPRSGHPWREVDTTDRLLFTCRDCDVDVPVTAADTQAGIRLYCLECDGEMELDWSWRQDD